MKRCDGYFERQVRLSHMKTTTALSLCCLLLCCMQGRCFDSDPIIKTTWKQEQENKLLRRSVSHSPVVMSGNLEDYTHGYLDRLFSSCSGDPKGSIHRAWGVSLIFVILYFIVSMFESESKCLGRAFDPWKLKATDLFKINYCDSIRCVSLNLCFFLPLSLARLGWRSITDLSMMIAFGYHSTIRYIPVANLQSQGGSKALVLASIWTGITHLGLGVLGTFVLKRFPTSFSVGFFLGVLVVLANQNLILFGTFHGYSYGNPATNHAFANVSMTLFMILTFFGLLLFHFKSRIVVAPMDAPTKARGKNEDYAAYKEGG